MEILLKKFIEIVFLFDRQILNISPVRTVVVLVIQVNVVTVTMVNVITVMVMVMQKMAALTVTDLKCIVTTVEVKVLTELVMHVELFIVWEHLVFQAELIVVLVMPELEINIRVGLNYLVKSVIL